MTLAASDIQGTVTSHRSTFSEDRNITKNSYCATVYSKSGASEQTLTTTDFNALLQILKQFKTGASYTNPNHNEHAKDDVTP